ncbi:MAG: hypothetical protein KGI19_07220 [Thaumarchaeota archaeon]|nr:hypothetical protein [Nitrososphaerota archaeon]
MVSIEDSCPFCGNVSRLQNPNFANHFHQDGTSNPTVYTPDGEISLPNDTTRNPVYHCDRCPVDYVPETLTIERLFPTLTYSRNAAMSIDHYYGSEVPLSVLLTNGTTRLFHQGPTDDSYLARYRSKRQIVFVINYNGIKTSGTILKMGQGSYKMNTLGEV